MFDFFDIHKNPFLAMMNPEKAEEDEENRDADGEMNPLYWMQQACELQMKMAKTMLMMPLQMMRGIAGFMGTGGDSGDDAEDEAPARAGGFQIGPMEIPPEVLQFLLKLEMSPENLKKLQKVLDFTLGLLPAAKDEE